MNKDIIYFNIYYDNLVVEFRGKIYLYIQEKQEIEIEIVGYEIFWGKLRNNIDMDVN